MKRYLCLSLSSDRTPEQAANAAETLQLPHHHFIMSDSCTLHQYTSERHDSHIPTSSLAAVCSTGTLPVAGVSSSAAAAEGHGKYINVTIAIARDVACSSRAHSTRRYRSAPAVAAVSSRPHLPTRHPGAAATASSLTLARSHPSVAIQLHAFHSQTLLLTIEEPNCNHSIVTNASIVYKLELQAGHGSTRASRYTRGIPSRRIQGAPVRDKSGASCGVNLNGVG